MSEPILMDVLAFLDVVEGMHKCAERLSPLNAETEHRIMKWLQLLPFSKIYVTSMSLRRRQRNSQFSIIMGISGPGAYTSS